MYHYAADRHALEQRCAFDAAAWTQGTGDTDALLIALTSIHWREAWKYGERAFRYCQHDLGHAIAALCYAAALVGCRAVLLPEWSHRDIASLTGIDRDVDYFEAEREEPGCVLAVAQDVAQGVEVAQDFSPAHTFFKSAHTMARGPLISAIRSGAWTGRANQLSEDHVQWTFIDDIARATEDPGRARSDEAQVFRPVHIGQSAVPAATGIDRALILQRRSALALDGRSSIDAKRFFAMLAAVMPSSAAPWDAVWWDARIHLALFVHRVDGLDPGLYLLSRNGATTDRLLAAVSGVNLRPYRGGTEVEAVTAALPLFRLARGDCRALAQRASCDQEIAADGFFSLGMIADFDASLEAFGPSFYRHLFWESGIVGQVLYLAAERAGARSTGIGCFYDDPMHDVLGLSGHAFQSLYHFTVGMPVEDLRLTTERGYTWE